jgi:hypothetical protein
MAGFNLKDVVTFSFAAVGAVLGTINTVQGLNQQRVKLRLTPKRALFVSQAGFSKEMGCIEVINLSAFPVTLSEIGFTVSGSVRKGKRAVITAPFTSDNQPFARRLESREAISGYFDLKSLPMGIRKAYVTTDCGEVVYGVSGAMQNLRRKAGDWRH